jgi:NodT family efflux transporter outer membrane factor (OMF) lipoprotein
VTHVAQTFRSASRSGRPEGLRYRHGYVGRGFSRAGIAVALLTTAFAAGCAHPPKYEPPKTVTPPAYKEQDAGLLQPAQPSDHAPRAAWWEVFNDPKLNELETQLSAGNPTLAQAIARYVQARALVRQNRAQFYPQVNVSAGVQAGRPSSRQGGTTNLPNVATDYTLSADASWEADLWGRIRHTVSAAVANAQAAAGDREALRLSLAAELAVDYFQLRTFDAEIELLNETIQAYEKSFQLTQNQYSAGLVARSDVAQAQTLLESARAQTIDSRLQRAQTEHAIAALLGVLPSAVSIESIPIAGEPPRLPAEMPSRLLERRPDIAAAERRVAAANAQIGVATAAFFPTLGISAAGGFETTSLQKLLSWPAGFWSVGPTLAYTLFDGGARRAVKAGAVAGYDVTVGAYRETVLAAFQDVEDNLAAQRLLAEEFDHQQLAVTAAQQALDISLNQYRAGLISFLQVAVEQAQLLNNQRSALSITGRRFGTAVGLIRALGGGWNGQLDDGPPATPAPAVTPTATPAPTTPPAR